jgi:hypothetical protein
VPSCFFAAFFHLYPGINPVFVAKRSARRQPRRDFP